MKKIVSNYENGKLFLVDSNRQPVWVAKITGFDSKYGFKREFLNKNLAVQEGRCLGFELENGCIYCWKEYRDQQYGVVENGVLYEISQADVTMLLNIYQ